MKNLAHPSRFALLTIHLCIFAAWPVGRAEASPAQLLASYTFDGDTVDNTGNSPPIDLVNNAAVTKGLLYLNGTQWLSYETKARIKGFSYGSFTIALDFNALDFSFHDMTGHDNIITGGVLYRWFSLTYNGGQLQVNLNNHSQAYIIPDSALSSGQWQSVICSVDVSAGKIITFVNHLRVADIDLPPGFQFNVVGTPAESGDMNFSFNDYATDSLFNGFVDNLKVWSRALAASEIDTMIGNPALSIQKAVLVTWPNFPAGYILQWAPNVNGPYESYTGSMFMEANQLKAAVPLGPTQKFFRLYKP